MAERSHLSEFSDLTLIAAWERQHRRCAISGVPIPLEDVLFSAGPGHRRPASGHHVVPAGHGGLHTPELDRRLRSVDNCVIISELGRNADDAAYSDLHLEEAHGGDFRRGGLMHASDFKRSHGRADNAAHREWVQGREALWREVFTSHDASSSRASKERPRVVVDPRAVQDALHPDFMKLVRDRRVEIVTSEENKNMLAAHFHPDVQQLAKAATTISLAKPVITYADDSYLSDKDKENMKLLNVALVSQARYLITQDKELLALRTENYRDDRKRFTEKHPDLAIVTPPQFDLAIARQQSQRRNLGPIHTVRY